LPQVDLFIILPFTGDKCKLEKRLAAGMAGWDDGSEETITDIKDTLQLLDIHQLI
jgi:hypothetical protein